MAVSAFNSIICAKIKAKELDRKIRVGAVSYLNTKPLLYGIERASIRTAIELIIDHPASIASMLVRDEIDMGLVPVAVIPSLREFHLNGSHCIGSNGNVASVCIFSETPIERIERLLLDYQSRTSVQLAKILLRDYWKIHPELVPTSSDARDQIVGTTAGVVIGDRALEQRLRSPYNYDLAGAWKELTGLPFVFAAWISNKRLDPSFLAEFDEANRQGLAHIDDVVAENPYAAFPLKEYFTRHLSYTLDPLKRKGLERFLQYLQVPAAPLLQK
jgi:chorismate dehydratase